MQGTTVEDAYLLFKPNNPLDPKELDTFYVSRPHSPLKELTISLKNSQEADKILFSGHRGSGKSTELRKLAQELEAERYLAQFSVKERLSVADLNYVDIVLACALSIVRKAAEDVQFIPIPESLLKDLYDFLTKEVTQETTVAVPKGGTISGKLNILITSIEAKYGNEATTRETMRAKLYARITELTEKTNEVCQEIAKIKGKRPLIIVEDIDKADMEHARTLFFDHATNLTSLDCTIIYTFREILDNLSLLEYQNGSVWCSVHPAVEALLNEQQPSAPME